MPAEATGTSEKSAKAFVRHWVDTLNYAGATGNSRELQQLSSVDCESCARIIQKIDRVSAHGGYFKGDGWTARSIGAISGQPEGRAVLEVGMFLAAQDVLERQGAKIQRFAGGKQPMIFRLSRSDAWVVARIDEVQ